MICAGVPEPGMFCPRGLVVIGAAVQRALPRCLREDPGTRIGSRGPRRNAQTKARPASCLRNRPALRDEDDDGPHGGTVGAVCRVAIETRSHLVLAGGFRGCSSRFRLIPRSGLRMEAT